MKKCFLGARPAVSGVYSYTDMHESPIKSGFEQHSWPYTGRIRLYTRRIKQGL